MARHNTLAYGTRKLYSNWFIKITILIFRGDSLTLLHEMMPGAFAFCNSADAVNMLFFYLIW